MTRPAFLTLLTLAPNRSSPQRSLPDPFSSRSTPSSAATPGARSPSLPLLAPDPISLRVQPSIPLLSSRRLLLPSPYLDACTSAGLGLPRLPLLAPLPSSPPRASTSMPGLPPPSSSPEEEPRAILPPCAKSGRRAAMLCVAPRLVGFDSDQMRPRSSPSELARGPCVPRRHRAFRTWSANS